MPDHHASDAPPERIAARRLRWRRLSPYLLMLPGLVVLAGIMWPFLQGVWWSFTDFSLQTGTADLNWGRNFLDLFRAGAPGGPALRTTLTYAAGAVSIQLVLGFVLALLLGWDAPWVKPFRVIVLLPLLMPPVIATLMWSVMMVDRGVLNFLIGQIGLGPIAWFGSTTAALPSLLLIDTWIFTSFVALLLTAGLQSIPEEIREAARVDGVGLLSEIWHIYLPLLRPFIIVVVVFRGIDSLKMFDVIWASTQGGPLGSTQTLHVLGYQEGVNYLNYGRSMAALLVLWVVCYALSFVLLRLRRREAFSHA